MTPVGRQNADLPTRAVGQAQPLFHRMLTAEPDLVREALAAVRARFQPEVGPDAIGRLELVLAEIMNNVIKHGGGEGGLRGRPVIHLCIVSHDGGLACALTDDGGELPAECLLPRRLPELAGGELPEGGFGWYLIQDLTQELCYYREDRRNFLAFRVPFLPEAG